MADTSLTFDIIARDRGASATVRRVARAIDEIDDSTTTVNRSLGDMGKALTLVGSRGVRSMAIVGIVLATLPALATAAGGLIVLGLGGALAAIGIIAAAQSQRVKDEFSSLRDHIVSVMTTISKPFEQTLLAIAQIARETFNALAPFISDAFKTLAPAVEKLASHLGPALARLGPLLPVIADAFDKLVRNLGPELPGIIGGIADGIGSIAAAVAANPEGFTTLVKNLALIAEVSMRLIGILIRIAPAVSIFAMNWGFIVNAIIPVILLVKLVRAAVSRLGPAFKSAGAAVVGAWNVMRSAAVAAWNRIRSAVASGVARVVGLARSLPGRIRSAVGNLGSLLWNAGRSVIQGLINGIKSAFGALRSILSTVTGLIPSWKGPLTADLRLLIPAGKAVMAGLMTGIRGEQAALRSMLTGVGDTIARGMTTPVAAMGVGAGTIGPGQGAAGGGAAGVVTVRLVVDGADADMKRMIRKMVRVDGRGDVQVAFG